MLLMGVRAFSCFSVACVRTYHLSRTTPYSPTYPHPQPPTHLHTVTPRRWLDQCNPGLSNLIQETLSIPKADFLKDLSKLSALTKYVDNPVFQKKWAAVKQSNKERLAHYVENALGLKINTHAMFDVQVKVCFFEFTLCG